MNTGARDMSARDASLREPGPPRQLYLPDFCRARTVLAIVIICELTALVLALARNEAAMGFWSDLARTSMFLPVDQPVRRRHVVRAARLPDRQSLPKGSAIVLLLCAVLVAIISSVAYWVGKPRRPGQTRPASCPRISGLSC